MGTELGEKFIPEYLKPPAPSFTMWVKWIDAVTRSEDLARMEQLVMIRILLAISTRGYCWLKLSTLCEDMHTSHKGNMSILITNLIKKGYLVREKTRKTFTFYMPGLKLLHLDPVLREEYRKKVERLQNCEL